MDEKKIARELLLEYVAPCSLLCYTCPSCKKGIVCDLAKQLNHYVEGYGESLKKSYPNFCYKKVLKKYDNFKEQLDRLSAHKCLGCRLGAGENGVCMVGCIIPECTKEQGVDFCGECNKFPCDKVKAGAVYNVELYEKWLDGSQKIKEVGAIAYFDEESKKAHYWRNKKNNEIV